MIWRLIPAFLLGLGVSAGLFWLMYAMVQHHAVLTERDPLTQLDFVRVQPEDPPREARLRELPPPPEADAPPPPVLTNSPAPPPPKGETMPPPAFAMPRLDLPLSGGPVAAPVTGADGWSLGLPVLDSDTHPQTVLPTLGGTASVGLAPIVRITPAYPIEARRKKQEGWVKVEFTVQEDGTVTDIKVREASPSGIFDQAAVAAIGQWKFRPAMQNGKAVRKRAVQTLNFALNH